VPGPSALACVLELLHDTDEAVATEAYAVLEAQASSPAGARALANEAFAPVLVRNVRDMVEADARELAALDRDAAFESPTGSADAKSDAKSADAKSADAKSSAGGGGGGGGGGYGAQLLSRTHRETRFAERVHLALSTLVSITMLDEGREVCLAYPTCKVLVQTARLTISPPGEGYAFFFFFS
jgi:hypothetical protein